MSGTVILDILVVLSFIVVVWGIGAAVLKLLGNDGGYDSLALVAGCSLSLIAINLLYFSFGMSSSDIRILLLTVCCCCLGYLLLMRFHDGGSLPLRELISTLVVFLILILPALIGGEQYFVVRGNYWDHFSYLTAAFGFSKFRSYEVTGFTDAFLRSNELYRFALTNIHARPSVMLLFAQLLGQNSGDIFQRGFFFTSALLAFAYSPLHLLCRLLGDSQAKRSAAPWLLSLLPLGYLVGFWGQSIFDINAWSQLASLAFLLGSDAAMIILLRPWFQSADESPDSPPSSVAYLVAGVLVAGAWLLYPENSLAHAGSVLLVACVLIPGALPEIRWNVVTYVAALPLIPLLCSLPDYRGTFLFVLRQLTVGAGKTLPWWTYFDSYVFGINVPFPDILTTFSFKSHWYLPFNTVVSLLGFYFVTPRQQMGLLHYPWVLTTIIFAVVLTRNFVFFLIRPPRHAIARRYLQLFILSGIVFIGWYLLRQKWWTAGKILSYYSPYCYLALIYPLVGMYGGTEPHHLPGISRFAAGAVLVLSFSFGAARIYSSFDENGIGYSQNYPLEVRHNLIWKLDLDGARRCSCVRVDIDDPFIGHYVKLKLAYAGIPYYSGLPINTYFGSGKNVGFMEPKVTDGTISLTSGPNRTVPLAELLRFLIKGRRSPTDAPSDRRLRIVMTKDSR